MQQYLPMSKLTDPHQYRLGLAMLAADRTSILTREERIAAIALVEDDIVPATWRVRVEAYLLARRAKDA